MRAIFFDLETTDSEPIGQILNYSFILTDESLKPLAELSERVIVSCLQLPRADSMLANRTDILEHQAIAKYSEKEAMRRIYEFFERCIQEAGDKVALIGFNSSRFDIPFLRTSLIRNGISPYFSGKLVYRDMLHAAKKLSCSRADFPRQPHAPGSKRALAQAARGETPKLSLSLENLCRQFDLLHGEQAHESRADVLLTIALAEVFKRKFDLDVISWNPYEATSIVRGGTRGLIINTFAPNYDLESESLYSATPWVLLDADYRYALWIDLMAWEGGSGRRSIRWHNMSLHSLSGDSPANPNQELLLKSQAALQEFGKLNLKNYFEKSSCDIEQDIYRVDFDGIDLLHKSFWGPSFDDLSKHSNPDIKSLYFRHFLREYRAGSGRDSDWEKVLLRYALYRYGGKAQISKSIEVKPDGTVEGEFHQTLEEQLQRVDLLLQNADVSDAQILTSLKQFYLNSRIYQLAGSQLMKSEDLIKVQGL